MAVLCLTGVCTAQSDDVKNLESPVVNSAKYDDWLIESGGQLRFKIRIELLLPSGKPAEDCDIRAVANGRPIHQSIRIEKNQVIATLEPFRYGQLPELIVETRDGRYMGNIEFPAHQVRKLSQEGMVIRLSPARQISVRVVDQQGGPVEGAFLTRQRIRTDEDGLALFSMQSDAKPLSFSVTTKDGRFGFLDLEKLKPENRQAEPLEIKLRPAGKKQTIKLIDEDGDGVPHVWITPQPMDRRCVYIPLDGYPMKTDENGEAEIIWRSSLPGPSAFVGVYDDRWEAISDERTPDRWTTTVRPLPRQKVAGRVRIPEGEKGGFLVQLTSFDHPTVRRADQIYVRTNDDGHFTANVLKHVPYAVYVVDAQWASEFWDGVMVNDDGTINQPELTLSPGKPLTIWSTVGPGKSPMPGTTIWVRQSRRFKTIKGSGSTGPGWSVTTDENGMAKTFVGEGRLEANIYSREYNDSRKIEILADSKNEIQFHRRTTELETISGRLNPSKNVAADFNIHGAKVYLHAVDGNYRFESINAVADDGSFDMRGLGERFALLAMTADKQAAGFAFAHISEAKDLTIDLAPTKTFRGRLVNVNQKPIADCKIDLELRLADPEAIWEDFFRDTKKITVWSTRSNADGNFEFDGVPVAIPLILRINDNRFPDPGESYLGKRMMALDDDRTREVLTVGRPSALSNWKERLFRMQLDCRINHARGLVVVKGQGERLDDFIQSELLGISGINKVTYSYLPLILSHHDAQRQDVMKTLNQWDCHLPGKNEIAVIVLDSDGEKIDMVRLDTATESAGKTASSFLALHQVDPMDANEKMESAFAEAKRTNRNVWAVVGHNRCSPCIRLARWMDVQKPLLEKDYVLVKIDWVRDRNAIEAANRINQGGRGGVPFFAIFNKEGAIIADANGPLGNIGFPAKSYEGIRHLEAIVKATANSLTDDEIDELIKPLK